MTGLFQFLAKLTDLVAFIWKRKAEKNDKPETKDANARKAIENEILHDDDAAANTRIHDALFRLRMRRNSQTESDKRGS
jgi:hypothetical protein